MYLICVYMGIDDGEFVSLYSISSIIHTNGTAQAAELQQ